MNKTLPESVPGPSNRLVWPASIPSPEYNFAKQDTFVFSTRQSLDLDTEPVQLSQDEDIDSETSLIIDEDIESEPGESIQDIEKFIKDTSTVQMPKNSIGVATRSTKRLKNKNEDNYCTTLREKSKSEPKVTMIRFSKKTTEVAMEKELQPNHRRNSNSEVDLPLEFLADQRAPKKMGRPPKHQGGAMSDRKRQKECRQAPETFLEVICPTCGSLISSRRDSIRKIIIECNRTNFKDKFSDEEELDDLIGLLINNAKKTSKQLKIIKAHKSLKLHNKGMVRFEKRLELLQKK